MPQPFIGEVRMFAGNFAPLGWSPCDGRLIPISDNDALFTLIGTTYGGDGQSTFALPNLQARVPVDDGQGPGQPMRYPGELGGVETVILTPATMAQHSHALQASTSEGIDPSPSGNVVATSPSISIFYQDNPNPNASLNAAVIGYEGGGQAHANVQPFQAINYIISLYGVFPPPS